MSNATFSNFINLSGRGLLAFVFIGAAMGKISAYDGTLAYMESFGVAGGLLPLVIALQISAGLGLLLGIGSRVSAIALAVFSVTAAMLFHTGADQVQGILFMKNLAISGGLLMVAAQGPGDWSLERFCPWRTNAVPAHAS